jgi:hypothetical protein
MKINKLKQWTQEEDGILRFIFNNTSFMGRHGSSHEQIKIELESYGLFRTTKAVSRRLNRLGLTFFSVNDQEVEVKCKDCKKLFKVSKRYLVRKNKIKYCKKCFKIHQHDWDLEHRAEVLAYHKEYHRSKK